ncbi:MAG: hypothetical protein ACRYG4_04335 [Janthinobacterium lividum]
MIDLAAAVSLLPAAAEFTRGCDVTLQFLTLHDCLRRLYGNDAVDRLEAAPPFGDVLVRIDGAQPSERREHRFGECAILVGDPPQLTYEHDADEQARFDAECARDLRGEDE